MDVGPSVHGDAKLAHPELPPHAPSEGLQLGYCLQTVFHEGRKVSGLFHVSYKWTRE